MTPIGRAPLAALAAVLTALTAPALAQRGPSHVSTNLPEDVLALACAPQPAFDVPARSMRITGGQDSFRRDVWAPGELLTINAGTDNGIEVGQEFFARRVIVDNNQRISRETPAHIRTSGWVKVYAVDPQMSLVTIVHACDTVDVGDYLEPFVVPVVPKPSTVDAKAQRSNYGKILFGNDYRRSFGKGDFFIVDRGSDHGVEPGDRFVVYRDRRLSENFLYNLGEAVAVDVRPETSTLKVVISRDAFSAGDYVAIRK